MFVLLFIVLPILAYIAVGMFGVVPFSLWMRAKEVPSPKTSLYGDDRYTLQYDDHQKHVRDFWEVVAWFFIFWPFEVLGALGWATFMTGQVGLTYLIDTIKAQQDAVLEKKIYVKLEDEREKIVSNASSDGELTSSERRKIASLDTLIAQSTSKQSATRALTSR